MYNNYRLNDIEQKLYSGGYQPLDVLVTGVTGSGKSTTLNAFFNQEVAQVGIGTDPQTMKLSHYSLNKKIRFWDSPGLGDGIAQDRMHSRKITDLLYKTYNHSAIQFGWIDLVLVIIDGSNRDMGTTYRLLEEVIMPNFQADRVLFIMNQADVAMKTRHWNCQSNYPQPVLVDFLNDKSRSIQHRIKTSTGMDIIKPVYYSAQYGYNVKAVYDLIIDHIPGQRRKLVA